MSSFHEPIILCIHSLTAALNRVSAKTCWSTEICEKLLLCIVLSLIRTHFFSISPPLLGETIASLLALSAASLSPQGTAESGLVTLQPSAETMSCCVSVCVASSAHVGLRSQAFVIQYAPASLCWDLMKYVSTQRRTKQTDIKNPGSFDDVLLRPWPWDQSAVDVISALQLLNVLSLRLPQGVVAGRTVAINRLQGRSSTMRNPPD